MSVQRIREYLALHWPRLASYGGLLAIVTFVLVWKLNTLLPGYSQPEADTYQASLSFDRLLDNPLNAPYLLLVKALLYVHPDSYMATRVSSVIIGAGILLLFGLLVRHWHGTRTAAIATLLFGTSAWFLHVTRMGTPEVMLFGIFALTACGFWLKQTNSWLALLACFGLAAVLLYVPGLVWFIVLAVIWQWRVIDRIFKKRLVTVAIGTVGFLAALAPLGMALYKDHALIKPWLGLPHDWPTPPEMIRNLLEIPYHLFVRGETNALAWLGTAPILDVFTLVMFLLGVYLYLRKLKLARTPVFISIMVLTAALMTLGSPVTFSIIMPFVYIVAAAGIVWLTGQWFTVFPRNPIARGIGWTLISLVVVVVCTFHLTHYFRGWPQAAATHEAYRLQKP